MLCYIYKMLYFLFFLPLLLFAPELQLAPFGR